MVALHGGDDGRDEPVGGHANGGPAVENGRCCGRCAWCFRGEDSWSRFFSLYGCSDRTRVSGVFLRELALAPLMTFGRFDLTVLLASGTVAGTVADDHTKVVKCSTRASLDGFLILIFSFLLALISSDFLSNIYNKNYDKEICKEIAH